MRNGTILVGDIRRLVIGGVFVMEKGESRRSGLAMVLGLCILAYMTVYMSRSTISVLATALRDHGVLTTAQYGFVGSVFFFTYAICKLFVGLFSDHVKPEYTIAIGVVVAGISNMMIGLYPKTSVVFVFWFLNAMGQSLPWGAMLIAVVGAAKGKRTHVQMSLLSLACPMGQIAGIVVASRAYSQGGLMMGFFLPGIITFITGFAVLFLMRTGQKPHNVANTKTLSILKDRTIRHLFFPIIIHGVIKDSVGFWFVAYIIHAFGIDISKISLYVFFIPLVGILSRTLYSVLFKMFGANEIKVSFFSYLMILLVTVPLCLSVRSVVVAIVCFSVITGLLGFAGISFIAMLPARYSGRNQTGLVAGGVDFIIYMGSAISSFCFGLVVERWGYTTMFICWEVLILISLSLMTLFFRRKIMDD